MDDKGTPFLTTLGVATNSSLTKETALYKVQNVIRYGIVVIAVVLVSCGGDEQPPVRLDGGGGDAANLFDSDGDGVCNSSEARYNTDSENADSDQDGFPDGVEIRAGYDPTHPSSPNRSEVIELSQVSTSNVHVIVAATVQGQGEDYAGAFEALYAQDGLGLNAADFYLRSIAVGATPEENIREVSAEQERFVEVSGDTTLVFDIEFSYKDSPTQPCKQSYPFLYRVKGTNADWAYAFRYLIVTLPAGQTTHEPPSFCAVTSCF